MLISCFQNILCPITTRTCPIIAKFWSPLETSFCFHIGLNFYPFNLICNIITSRISIFTFKPDPQIEIVSNRHFSVTPYITICKTTETYRGLYVRGAMSAVTGIYLFRLLLNIVFFVLRYIFTLTNSAYPDEMPHDGISQVYKSKNMYRKYISQLNAADYLFLRYFLFQMNSLVVTCE